MKRWISFALALCLLTALFPSVQAAASADDRDEMLACLKALDILEGDETGDLKLSAPVTRAAFAKLLAATSPYRDDLDSQGAGYSLFTDVKSGHWAGGYIKLCLDNGWMIGYTDGSFRPDDPVSLEEACTAELRLLGYDSADLSGPFPAAQLNKAAAVGLRDGLSAQQGQELAREDCARLFYNLLTCKTAQGQVYASTLNLPLDSDGEVDYLAAVKEDLEGPFLSGETAPALPTAPEVIYLNGQRVSNISWQKDDVYYYAHGYLWVYREPVYGQISALNPTAADPETVSVNNKTYTLGGGAVKEQLSALGSRAVGANVTLLLGMDGEVAAVRAVSGPFVAGDADALSFTPRTVYRDGVLSDSAALSRYDVYYYSADESALWIYTDRVSGRIQALTPSLSDPTAVTISGQSYTLATDTLSRKLSSLNGKWTDRFVTLLLGMDGTVVEVLTDEAVEVTYYGVVQSAAKAATDGAVEWQVTLLCTDGRQHTFSASASQDWEAGDLVRVTVDQDGAKFESLRRQSLSGAVDASASKADNYVLADNIKALDVDEDGNGGTVERSELAGLTLSENNVLYYALNDSGQVEHLILQNATEVLWEYGLLTEVETQSRGSMSYTNQYTILVDGQSRTYSLSNRSFPAVEGQGVAVRFSATGEIVGMRGLTAVELNEVRQSTATGADGKSYDLAAEVNVCLRDADWSYYAMEREDLKTLDAADYAFTGYYDMAQGKLQVILARKK